MTCDRLLGIAGAVKSTMRGDDDNGLGLAYEKLTHGYWREYIRSTVLSLTGERTYPESSGALLLKIFVVCFGVERHKRLSP